MELLNQMDGFDQTVNVKVCGRIKGALEVCIQRPLCNGMQGSKIRITY